MPGWREVCDDCSTTLFNCHSMCKLCGYMICIECVNRYSQMNPEKRKSKNPTIYPHEILPSLSFRIETYLST